MDPTALISNLWLLVSTTLVFFMQAGFCCLEAGSVRSKNSVNVALKNVVTFLVGAVVYYIVGYSLMYGPPLVEGLVGFSQLMLEGIGNSEIFVFLYQLVFCTTAATIVSGAVAERMRFLPYIIGTAALSLVIYPIFGYWVWNSDGWLHRLGYHDFAGSSVVHLVGAMVSLGAIKKIGARLGRFDENGKPVEIVASNIPLVALGVFILIFGWMGFNGGSAPFGLQTGKIVLNTLMGAIFGGLVCLFVGWAIHGISGAFSIMNGSLAGLVAITAGADVVSHQAAALIGCGGGLAYFYAEKWLLRLKLDDAVGAVPVHGGAGLTGIILTGVFAENSYLEQVSAMIGDTFTRPQFILIQFLGALVCMVWAYLLGILIWKITGAFTKLRVSETEEEVGLNYSEHQLRGPHDEE